MKKLYFLIIAFTFFNTAFSQWTSNTQVNTDASTTSTGDAQTVGCSDGKTWVVWSKNVPSPNYYEMRAQLLDVNGVKQLGPEGVLVNNVQQASFTTLFASAIDNNNNLILGFTSNSNGTTYFNKISQTGVQFWGATGVPIANSIDPKITVLNNNDVVISWLDQVLGTRGYMQKLASATGALAWTNPIAILPSLPSHRTVPGNLLPLSNNGFLLVYHDRAVATGVSSTLWAQRYDVNGVSQWATPVQLSDKGTGWNRTYYPSMDNDTLFLGFMGSTGFRLDCFVQRLNPDGTIPWGLNGSDFATDDTYYEGDIRIIASPATNVIWASGLVETSSQGSQGTYVQKFNKQTGARLLTNNGKVVYPILPPPQVIPFGIQLFSDNLPLLLLGKYTSFSDNKMYATKLDNNGNFMWPGDTTALGTFVKDKSRIDLTRVVNDQAVAFWVETKTTFDQPYAQNIRKDGTTGLLAPVANFTSNNTSACINTPIQYTSTATGYISTYAWTFPGGTPATSTSANPSVTYAAPGVYNVTLTVSNSGGANTKTLSNYVTITSVTPTAALAGSTTNCIGTPSTYTVTGTNLGTAPIYNWTVNGTAVVNNTNTLTLPNNIVGTNAIACNVTSNAACAYPAIVSTNTISSVVNALPQITFNNITTPLCNTDLPIVLSASPAGGVFSMGGVPLTTFSPSTLGNGSYNLQYNVTVNGCSNTMANTIVVKECTERHLLVNQPGAIIILNNPSNGAFGILVKSDIITKLSIATYNNLGQLITKKDIANIGYGTVIPMNLTLLANGEYYLYLLNAENGQTLHKTFKINKLQ